MNKKMRRQNRIREIIRREKMALTVSEIFSLLAISIEGDISRKTVERDIDEMIARREIKQAGEAPLRLIQGEVRVRAYLLSDEEVDLIVESIQIMNGPDRVPIIKSIITKMEREQ